MSYYIDSFIVLVKKNLVFLNTLLEKDVYQSKPFQNMFLYIFLKMKRHSNIVLLYININVILKDIQEQLDSNKYFSMIIGIFNSILLLIQRVMFYLNTMKINIKLNLHGAKQFCRRITESSC